MGTDFHKNFFGESNTMLLYIKNEEIIFKSKLYLNALIFIMFIFFLILPFMFFDFFYPIYFIFLYFFVSGIFALTYRRGIIFKKGQKKLIYYKSFFGFKNLKEYDFSDIEEIILRTFRAPIVGLQVPLLIKKYSLEILLNNGKRICIDRSSDFDIIKKYSELISQVKPIRIVK